MQRNPIRTSALLLAVAALWPAGSALGAVLVHVSPRGSDGNPGTADRPFATIRAALKSVAGSDQPVEVVIHEGVYPGNVMVGTRADLTAGPRPALLVRAAKKPDGSFVEAVVDGARQVENCVALSDRPGVFKMPARYNYFRRPHMWEADTRTRYTLVADLAAVAHYPASFWYDESTVYFHTSDGRPPRDHDMGMSRDHVGIAVWRPNVTVRGIQCRNLLAWRWSSGVELRAPNTAAEDCRVQNSVRGFQIMMEPPGTRVFRCRTDDCAGGVYSQGTRGVVEDCRFYKIRDGFMVPAYPQDDTGIQFYHPAFEGEVRGNLCVGFCNGIFIKCKDSQFIVENNTCVDGISFGVGCTKWHPKTVIRHNVVVGFSTPFVMPNALKPTTVLGHNCLWGADERQLQRAVDAAGKAGVAKHNVAADPMFYAPAAGDYRLLPASPCAKMGPKGESCGAFGVVEPGFKDVRPPSVSLTAAAPARQAASAPTLWHERDPWMGGYPNAAPSTQAGPSEWLTPTPKVTIYVQAQDHVSKPAQMKIRVKEGAWGAAMSFREQIVCDLTRHGRRALVSARVSDGAGNWSEPASIRLRLAATGPKILEGPSVRSTSSGSVVLFATDVACKVTAEFGKDNRYGSTFEQPAHVQRAWLSGSEDRSAPRVSNVLALLPPTVEPGATYHYRLVLEDELGNKTVTPDATFALRGRPEARSVSPNGEDVEAGGTRQKPWRTIQFAVDRALPGDRIVLLPGLHTGESILTHGGIEGAPITIEGEEPGKAVLDSRHHADTCLKLLHAPHVVIKGLEVRWFGRGGTFYSGGKAGIFVERSPNVTVHGCRIWNDFWMGWPIGSGICARWSPGFVADRNVIYQVEQGITLYFSPGARITHNTIFKNMYGAVKFLYSLKGTVSRNNSFCFSGNDQFVVAYREKGELAGFDSDYNNVGTKLRSPDPGDEIVPDSSLFRHHGSKAVISLNRKRFNSLRAWREATGKDRHSIFRDPKYVDPEHWDLRLKPDSPNIGAGEGGATIGALGSLR